MFGYLVISIPISVSIRPSISVCAKIFVYPCVYTVRIYEQAYVRLYYSHIDRSTYTHTFTHIHMFI